MGNKTTKFILSSGGIKKSPHFKNFLADIFQEHQNEPKILLCFFASQKEYWEDKFISFSETIKNNINSKIQPEFGLASLENFEQEVKENDIIFFYGGDVEILRNRLLKYDLITLFKNKIVSGSSAGAAIFVKPYWSADWGKIGFGFNFIPVKVIPHFGEKIERPLSGAIDWEKAKKELKEIEPKDLEITHFPAGSYKVFEVDFNKNTEKNIAFIDGQNLYRGTQDENIDLDYEKLFKYLKYKHQAQKVYLFLGYLSKMEKMYQELRGYGYELVFKEVSQDNAGKTKGNVDIDLTLKIMLEQNNFDQAILITSDGDFAVVVKYLKSIRKFKTLISPSRNQCSFLLKKTAREKVRFLEDIKNKIEKKKHSADL